MNNRKKKLQRVELLGVSPDNIERGLQSSPTIIQNEFLKKVYIEYSFDRVLKDQVI